MLGDHPSPALCLPEAGEAYVDHAVGERARREGAGTHTEEPVECPSQGDLQPHPKEVMGPPPEWPPDVPE